ncbi:MAG: cation:proton antiporter [Chloroflexi bacterium]|nr:cation:proton antiporter [Chloroflexota bacterium]
MREIVVFMLLTGAGYIAGQSSDFNPVEAGAFEHFAALALVLGLYSSVSSIDLLAVRAHRWLAVTVITLAVPLQILATGALMYLIYPEPISFLAAVAITQIDPLSVDTLLKDKASMSEQAKGILRIWASFDDPVTVIFGFLVLLPLVSDNAGEVTPALMLLGLIANLGPGALLWWISVKTRLLHRANFRLVILAALLIFSLVTRAYLLAAIVGLLLRPTSPKTLNRVVEAFYYVIVFVVGMAISSYGLDLRLGFLLAVTEFFVIQPVTTIIVFSGTPADLLRIAFAQQNGLTTLLMGLAFEALDVHVLPILLPAIIAVNLMNLAVNKIYSYKERAGLIKERAG